MTSRGSTAGEYRAVVVGTSAGGMAALGKLLSLLPGTSPLTVIAVQHLHPTEGGYLVEFLRERIPLPVREAEDKMPVLPGHVYIAPATYHLLIEREETFSLSIDAKVNYARPSIDVLFESAARVWGCRLIGILLTGANQDGTYGLEVIKANGGLTIAQDPATAESPVMPQSAVDAGAVDKVMALEEMGMYLKNLGGERPGRAGG